ncbi:hypothetical protein BD769DRAFT_367714 [Suillus cothurnatus]|nr:hypothetical protein BD769DRAFT_367714 [Suillus cothurnatus]
MLRILSVTKLSKRDHSVSHEFFSFFNVMAARRMDISSLLCDNNNKDGDNNNNNDDDDDQQSSTTSPLISQPVILAPHLRGKHARQTHNYIPQPRELTSPNMPPRTIDALIHHPRQQIQSSPRPDSSQSHSSVNALLNPVRSPFVSIPLLTSSLSLNPIQSMSHPRTGLDALVHAASEERRRISAGSSISESSSSPVNLPPPRPYPFYITDDSPRPHKRIRESRSPTPPQRSLPNQSPTASALSSSLTGPAIPHLSSPSNIPLSGPGITPSYYQPPLHRSPTRHSPVVPTRMSPIVYAAMRSDVPRLGRAVWDEEEVDDHRRREEPLRHSEPRDHLDDHRQELDPRQRQELDFRQLEIRQRQEFEIRQRQELEIRQRHELELRQRERSFDNKSLSAGRVRAFSVHRKKPLHGK